VIVFPGVMSIALLVWLFGTVANITDTLLIFLPRDLTHHENGLGPMYWYWSLVAFAVAVFLVGVIGLLARNYFGKRLIEWVEDALLQVPLLNKIYVAIKQVNDAFSSGKRTAFRTVVLVEFPSAGMHSIGFVTNEHPAHLPAKGGEKLICVFVPTTPNPTSGFLVLIPEEKVTKLDISVAEGIKYIISLGSLAPEAIAIGRTDGDSAGATVPLRS
jgi:uncharacterized membrane protein